MILNFSCNNLLGKALKTKSAYNTMRYILVCFFIWLFVGGSAVLAQIQHEGSPQSFLSKNLKLKNTPMRTLTAVNSAEMIALDIKQGIDNRFGVLEEVNIDLKKAGTYEEVNGYGVWVYAFSCETAKSMSVYLSTFDVPLGAKLFVYSADRKVVLGAFTQENNLDGDGFAIADIKGGSYVVEYNEPLTAEFEGGVIIKDVSKAYLDVEERALPKRVGINCPAGADFQEEKRAVARMHYRSGIFSYWCSGSLINNEKGDGLPYFLTANHCISTASEASTLITYFNYENSGCSTSDAKETQTISGASLKATNVYTDFSLLLLDVSGLIPESYQPYYLGWDVTGKVPQGGTAIHHPMGSPKCISIDNDMLVSYEGYINWDDKVVSDPNTHWKSSYEIGADEGGSSGSPILDQNHRVVGQLHGGDDDISLWGKLSLSWKYNSSATAQLASWLDPNNTGIQTLDGLDYYAAPSALFTADPNPACVDSEVLLKLVSATNQAKRQWTITPSTYHFASGSSKTSLAPRVYFDEPGIYTISCKLTASNGNTDTKSLDLEVAPRVDVEFVGMPDEMDICGRELKGFQIEAEGASKYTFKVVASEYFLVSSEENILTLTLNNAGKLKGTFDTYIYVNGKTGNCTDIDTLLLHVQAPVNDNAGNAIAIQTGLNGPYSNVCGSVQTEEPYPGATSCIGPYAWCPVPSGNPDENPLDNSVWFTFVSPDNGYVELTVSGIESQLALYAVGSPSDLFVPGFNTPMVVATADTVMGTETKVILNLENGVRYYLQIDGRDGDEGDFTIDMKNSTASIYPSISSDGLITVVLPNLKTGRAVISIFGAVGGLVYQTTSDVYATQSTYQYNWGFLKPALYIVKIEIGGVTYVSKLLIVA